MSYYTRAFCKHPQPPCLHDILKWCSKRGMALIVNDPSPSFLNDPHWDHVEIQYKKDKLPLLVELYQADSTVDAPVKAEVQEFQDRITRQISFLNLSKPRVLAHLTQTRFIVSSQLPSSDIDEDGYQANWTFLTYFAENCGGILQADHEGFYEKNKLVLKMS